ncbi:MAG: hypothetical protein A2102_03075 [Tenericutes bacterium GWF2_38_8]|nr:MAG: hypothetical protein A2102_03075 [Tenericutes bacterium GWF2_38_8]HCB67388.1 hypothetical protein [Acholeplasmataceae bacterium]
MKKLFILIGMIMLVTGLVSCNEEETVTYTLDQVIDSIEITYAPNDTMDSVTSNITLPLVSELTNLATIVWESGNASVIDNFGTVNRQPQDVTVTLILTVTLGSSSKQVLYDLTVIGTTVYYTVTIDINGVQTEVEVAEGTRLPVQEIPQVSGYIFTGWYTDLIAETKYLFSALVYADITIYAGFREYLSGTYSYDIYLQNIEDDEYTLFDHQTGTDEEGVLITMEDSFTGFEFNDELSTMSGTISSLTNLQLEAYFDRLTYTITYISDGVEQTEEVLRYQELTSEIVSPTKDGYEFLGWSVSPSGTTYFTFGAPISSNITLYAQWEYLDDYTYEGYYEGADGLTGSELNTFLRTITTNGFTGVNYGDARYILDETDRDPNNSNNLILVYLGTSVSAAWDGGVTWNREHVWPQSLLGVSADNDVINAASDLQNLKPADPATNSSRGNKYFDNVTTPDSYNPRDAVKGDIARILFYMDTRYSEYTLVNGEPSVYQMALLYRLLQWHVQDPVDSFEMNRNNIIYNYQHNRNPFIDHPEFVEKLYGPIILSNGDSVQVPFYSLNYTIEIDAYILNSSSDKKNIYQA